MSETKLLNYKEESKRDWSRYVRIDENGNAFLSDEQLQLGAILRIADSMDKMAENYDRIISDRNMYKRWYEIEQEMHSELKRKYRALKGQLTKCKKQLNHEHSNK